MSPIEVVMQAAPVDAPAVGLAAATLTGGEVSMVTQNAAAATAKAAPKSFVERRETTCFIEEPPERCSGPAS
jgi:hypothetical protein